jgi:hypothetical protein
MNSDPSALLKISQVELGGKMLLIIHCPYAHHSQSPDEQRQILKIQGYLVFNMRKHPSIVVHEQRGAYHVFHAKDYDVENKLRFLAERQELKLHWTQVPFNQSEFPPQLPESFLGRRDLASGRLLKSL